MPAELVEMVVKEREHSVAVSRTVPYGLALAFLEAGDEHTVRIIDPRWDCILHERQGHGPSEV